MWEEDLDKKFKETIIPKSVKSHQYPFLQVRIPQHPDFMLDETGKKYSGYKYPKSNIEYTTQNIENEFVNVDFSSKINTKETIQKTNEYIVDKNDVFELTNEENLKW